MSRCGFCGEDVDPEDPYTWKLVEGWVGGPRKDSMRLRRDTGHFAHSHCVAKVQAGQAADQEDLETVVEGNVGGQIFEVHEDTPSIDEVLGEESP